MTRNKHSKYLMVSARLVFILFFSSLLQISYCQLPQIQKTNGASIQSTSTIYLDDLFKQPYKQNKYPDIKGSPFYIDDWKYADLLFTDGKLFNKVTVKLNLYTQELIYLSPGNVEIILKDGIISRMILYDTSETGMPGSQLFASGFPVLDKDTTFPFFEVIAEGKAMLLNLIKKRITDTKDALSPTDGKEFVTTETCYIFFNKEIKKCEKNNDFYINLFSDKKNSIENLIKLKKLKCRNRKDVTMLVEYYNSL
ncbi:MAG: hypothetical protein M3O67_04805 [Bacteroidota bacterium]|nr:hypothetical protein [Bacteroidota bacterium]